MYTGVLAAHNLLRWLVLAAAALAIFLAFKGWLGKEEWKESTRRAWLAFVGLLDLNVLVGVALYAGLSPLVRTALGNMKAAMKDPNLRFFAVEHLTLMVGAVILAHVGSIMVKRSEGSAKYRQAAIWYSLAVVVIMLAIPWSRPLLPH